MNLEEMKKTGVNGVEILDSLNAPMLKLSVQLNDETIISEENELKMYIDTSKDDTTKRKMVVFNLERPLGKINSISDEFILEPAFKGNKVTMVAYVKRKTTATPYVRDIIVGDNLSGKTLKLTLPEYLDTAGNDYRGIIASDKYCIREKFTSEGLNEINQIEVYSKEDNEVIQVLSSNYSSCLNEYKLPNDFGEVTYLALDGTSAVHLQNIKVVDFTISEAENETIENVIYHPITLYEGSNYITTNYENATINLIYPKNTDLIKSFLVSSLSYNLNNEDKFLTLDDLYFKDCFTELDDGLINALFNKLTIKCMNSVNNNFTLDCDGNLRVNSVTTKEPIVMDFNQIYPVGSIYISTSVTNPSKLFGGTWKELQGRFLLGRNATYAAGTTGGAATHSHTQGATNGPNVSTTGSTTLNINQIPAHTHSAGTGTNGFIGHLNTMAYGKDDVLLTTTGAGSWVVYRQPANAGGGQGHTHSLNNHTHTNPNTAASNNMPPYLAVYMWERIA